MTTMLTSETGPGADLPRPHPAASHTCCQGLRLLQALLGVVLAGCASGVPQAIREAPLAPITPAEAAARPASSQDQGVRWGGTILAVRNSRDGTEVEVLARPLGKDGEPREGEPGQGRFIARVDRFLDPAEYPLERSLTVAGRLIGTETRPVGEYPYAFPIVAAQVLHVWPKLAMYPVWYPSPWYDPWHYPWYGPGWFGYGPRPWHLR